MSTTISKRLLGSVVAGLTALALLAGCAGGSAQVDSDAPSGAVTEEYSGQAPQDGAAGDSSQAEPAPQAPGDESQVAERDVITTTSADIRVEDVPGSVGKLEQLVTKHDGRIEARTERVNDAVPEAYLTVRIPADQNDAFLTELKELGEVMQIETQALDVTLERVDLESRISSLKSSIASLEAMLEKATNVEDMLDIEQELGDRQAELQSLEAQLEVLSEDVAMSTVYVNLSSSASPQPIDEPSGFWGGLVKGWNDFVASLNEFVTDFGYAIPGLVLLLVILGLLWLFVGRPIVRRARKRAAVRGEQLDARPEWPGPGAAGAGAAAQATPDRQQRPEPEHAEAATAGEPSDAPDASDASDASTNRDSGMPPLPKVD
ncbi:DUF4349 domain-containing protein [Gulosibacter molinativorax]|nr:DUF4349 domain-containing protein [Gulosibacter molinativorax]QUY62344.1 Hypotetical protein [Gulosibacter molinativorax]